MLQDNSNYQFEQRADEELLRWLETASPDLTKQPKGPQPQRAYWHVEAATNYDPVNSHCYVKIELNTADLSAKPVRRHNRNEATAEAWIAALRAAGLPD